MEGDVIMSINDVPVSTHASAAKLIREAQGDIMLKMVTQQPRRTVGAWGWANEPLDRPFWSRRGSLPSRLWPNA